MTGDEEIENSNHRKARAEVLQNVRSSTMTKVEEREKERSDGGGQVRQKDSPLQNQKSGTGRQEKTPTLVFLFRIRLLSTRQDLRLSHHSPSFTQKAMQIKYEVPLRANRQR